MFMRFVPPFDSIHDTIILGHSFQVSYEDV